MKMKKYLMTGIAALALCVGFTSCSHDLEPMSQEEIDQMEAQKVVNTYKAAFEQYIGGKVAANQTWGFSGTFASGTRAVDVNHNMWYQTGSGIDEIYGKLEEDPVVTDEERMGVFRYMNHADDRQKVNNLTLDDYFVSQVWDGGTNYIVNNTIYGVPTQDNSDPRQYNRTGIQDADNKITDNGIDSSITGAEYTPLTTSFAGQNGETVNRAGGDYMDYLFVNETGEGDLANGTIDNKGIITGAGGWTHINNFNSADCPDPWYAGKTWMTKDKETGIKSGTYDFAYNQTNGGTFFSHKYLIISGNEIFANNPEMKAKYGKFYYVCFDFEKPYTDAEKANETTFFYYTPTDNKGYEQAQQKISLPGYYTNANIPTDAVLAAVKANNGNYVSISNVSVAGYNYGTQHFNGDNNYTDWIVRISPANYEETPPTPPSNADLRVMAEDLTNGTTDEDFDFNDIVFDVYFGAANTAKVVVKAAGGTLDLRIARVENPTTDADWSEVHGLFASVNPGVNCANKMINTHGTDADQSANVQRQSLDGLTCPEFTLPFAVTTNADAKKIKIQVKKGGNWVEITSEQGEPAAKFAVPHTYGWMKERTSIKAVNETFTTWCQGESELIWVGGINE